MLRSEIFTVQLIKPLNVSSWTLVSIEPCLCSTIFRPSNMIYLATYLIQFQVSRALGAVICPTLNCMISIYAAFV